MNAPNATVQTASFAPQRLTVLGATGSIGLNTLDVVARHPGRYQIYALTAHRKIQELAALCRQHQPQVAVVADRDAAHELQNLLAAAGLQTEVRHGAAALAEVSAAAEVDTVMAAIVGAAGLEPTLAAVRAGKRVLLANKEALVMAGPLFMAAVRQAQAVLLPIDSEHNAIFQALPATYAGDPAACGVRRILLTASGGPFRSCSLDALQRVTPTEACNHPNWVMGRKISVDSASMMNKGLEVIEARWLFNVPADDIQVVVHPQSVIHSLVEYIDGSVLAQLGNPDMRTPIAHALAYPERIDAGVSSLDLFQIAQLNFEPPDLQRFPCLRLAYQALRAEGSAPALLNAANEVAVAAFLEGRLAFLRMAEIIDAVLQAIAVTKLPDLESVLDADRQARRLATDLIAAI